MKHFLLTTLAMFLGTLGAMLVMDAWHAHQAARTTAAALEFDRAQARARKEEADKLREIMQAHPRDDALIPHAETDPEPSLRPSTDDQVDDAQ